MIRELRTEIANAISDHKAYDVPGVCVRLGLEGGNSSEAFNSKFRYAMSRLVSLPAEDLLAMAKTLLQEVGGGREHVCGFPVRDVSIRAGEGTDASTLQPLMAGSIRHYANLYESPFDVFATCTPASAGQSPKTVKLPRNTKDCYLAGGKLECSYLADGEMVPAE